MSNKWQITDFDPETATPEMWRLYHDYRRARQAEREPEDPIPPDDVAEKALRLEREDEDWAHYDAVIVHEGKLVSYFSAGAPKPGTTDYVNNGHLLFASAGVLGPWRRRGIGRAWLRYVHDRLPLTGATTVMVQTHEPDGHAFMEWLSGPPKQRERFSRADFRTLDWGMIDRWVADQAARAPGYSLELHAGRLPEALWDEYCAAKTEQMRHIPRDGLDMGDWTFTPQNQADMYKWMDAEGADHHVIWVRDAEGRIAAITDVARFPYAPELIQQFFTGVDMRARGMGLGKLVKARMLRFVGDTYGYDQLRWVRTDNATTNAAMLAINVRLGFREYKVSGIYQATQAQIEAYLGQAR